MNMRNLLNKGKFLEEKYSLENYNGLNYEPVCCLCCNFDGEYGICIKKNEIVDPYENAEDCDDYYD